MKLSIKGCNIALALAATAAVTGSTASAGDWPHWRGPNHNGAADEVGLPGKWDDSNIRWKAPLPGVSSASPIVLGDRVFCVSNDESMTAIYRMCLSRDTGEVLWKKAFTHDLEQPKRNNTLASPSPVTDGEKVYFMFGTGDLIATDLDGNELWTRNLASDYGPINQQFGYSSTPLAFNGKLYLAIMRGQWDRLQLDDFTDEDSYVICIDPATGKTLWKTHRNSDGADEAFDSYSSPSPYEYNGVSAIITQGANYVIAHDAASGEELWRQNHNPERGRMWRLIPSPMAAGELVIGVQPRGQAAFAVMPEKGKSIAYNESHWIYDEKTTDVPCPVYYQDRVYLLNGVRGLLFCLDAKTGKEIWTGELGADSRIWASPVVGDGKMYCISEEGQVTTVAIGDAFEVLSQNALGGKDCKSTIAIADGKLFIRTSDALYCVEAK